MRGSFLNHGYFEFSASQDSVAT